MVAKPVATAARARESSLGFSFLNYRQGSKRQIEGAEPGYSRKLGKDGPILHPFASEALWWEFGPADECVLNHVREVFWQIQPDSLSSNWFGSRIV